MPKTKKIYSKWYKNGEDIFFEDEEFHKLAYKITYTYQKYMAKMELEYGEKAYYEAKWRGWYYEGKYMIGQTGHTFTLPGWELDFDYFTRINGSATITMLES